MNLKKTLINILALVNLQIPSSLPEITKSFSQNQVSTPYTPSTLTPTNEPLQDFSLYVCFSF